MKHLGVIICYGLISGLNIWFAFEPDNSSPLLNLIAAIWCGICAILFVMDYCSL